MEKKTVFRCEICGEVYSLDQINHGFSLKIIDGIPVWRELKVCPNCFEEEFDKCEVCGEFVEKGLLRKESLVCSQGRRDILICEGCFENEIKCAYCGAIIASYCENIDGEYYCEECINGLFVTCEKCGEKILLDEAIETNWGFYCKDCYDQFFTCEMCGEEIPPEYIIFINDDEYDAVCENCFSEFFIECYCCGRIIKKGNEVLSFELGGHTFYVCPNCKEEIKKCPICHQFYPSILFSKPRLAEVEMCYYCAMKFEAENKIKSSEYTHYSFPKISILEVLL